MNILSTYNIVESVRINWSLTMNLHLLTVHPQYILPSVFRETYSTFHAAIGTIVPHLIK